MLDGIVYGPVLSRRLGRSLGINLCPRNQRACDLDCVYCPLAGSRRRARGAPDWPTPAEVRLAMSRALRDAGPLDSITISGDGEPTLHPHLGAVIAEVLGAARGSHPDVPVRILSNGSGTVRPVERRALACLDECILKLDAAPRQVERPAPGTSLEAIAEAYAHLDDPTLQACFVAGTVSNVEDEAVIPWLDLVAAIRPRAVQVYTIDRAGWVDGVGPASPARLREIGDEVRRRTGAAVQVTDR